LNLFDQESNNEMKFLQGGR